MKAKKAAGANSGPSRLGILGVVLLVVELGGCTLVSTGIVTPPRRYNLSATIESSDIPPVRSEVSSENLMMFAGETDTIFAFHNSYQAGVQWLRYLNRILDARGGEEAFRAVYGTGPWCVIGAPEVTETDVEVDAATPGIADEEGEALRICGACGEECGNDPGVVPILEVTPTTMPNVVDFGTVPVGSSSVREVTFANSGEGRLCLRPPSINGSSADPEDFVLAALSGCTAAPGDGLVVLEGSMTCRFRVTFTPSGPGTRSARVPGARGCADFITLTGVGTAGQLTAAPAPACFTPPTPPETCREVAIQVDNPGPASVTLISTSLTDSAPGRWELVQLETGGMTPIDLGVGPYMVGPGELVRARVRACASATDESTLRIMHNGIDYGAPGSPTGDTEPGSPLVVRLLPPNSGCTP